MEERKEQAKGPSGERRRVVLGLFALIFPGILLAQTDVSRWAKVVVRIRALYARADKLLEWTEWGEEAAASIGIGKRPPHPPYSGSDYLLKQVEEARAEISDISVPAFDAPLPVVATINFGDPPAARDAIRNGVHLLGSASAEMIQAMPVLPMLDAYKSKLGAIARALEIFSDQLTRLVEMGVDFTEQFSWRSFTIQSDYIPAVNGLSSHAEAKQRDVRDALVRRAAEIRQSIDWLRSQLTLEAQSLAGEVARLKKLRDDLEARKIVLDQRENQLRKMRETSNDLLRRYNILSADLSNNRNWLRNAESAHKSLYAQYIDWSETQPNAWRCPEGATLRVCVKHPYLVNQFRAQQAAQLDSIGKSMSRNQQEQNQYRNEIARIDRGQQDLLRQVDQIDTKIQQEESSLKAAKDQWDRDTQKIWAEHWKSKANLFIQENANDAGALGRLSTQLNL